VALVEIAGNKTRTVKTAWHVLSAALNVNSLAELIAMARKEPGKLNWRL
jgi:hypothetical protein